MSEIQFNALFSFYMFDILVCMISLSIYNGSERYECSEKSIWQAESSTESSGDYFLSFCFFYYYSWWSICHSFFSFSFCSGQTSSVGPDKGPADRALAYASDAERYQDQIFPMDLSKRLKLSDSSPIRLVVLSSGTSPTLHKFPMSSNL